MLHRLGELYSSYFYAFKRDWILDLYMYALFLSNIYLVFSILQHVNRNFYSIYNYTCKAICIL